LQLYSRFCLREKCFTNWIDPKSESGKRKQKQLARVKWKVKNVKVKDATTKTYLEVIKAHYFSGCINLEQGK